MKPPQTKAELNHVQRTCKFQLQEARDRLQQKEDSLETSEEQLQVQTQQSAELGLRLRTVQVRKKSYNNLGKTGR